MNIQLKASHAVEDAAVAYLEQLEKKQKDDRRELWLQIVHAETLEVIIEEWKSAAEMNSQHKPTQDATRNVLRNDNDCPGQAGANHKGDHPTTPAAGEMFAMTPTCALTWRENDAA